MFAMVANRLVAPCSKRRLGRVGLARMWSCPGAGRLPPLDQLLPGSGRGRRLQGRATETHLYSRLCDLTNLDLRLVCYDVASTYFEGSTAVLWPFPFPGVRLLA